MKRCEICKENSGKRNVCLKCKEKYPYKLSGEGGIPFNRKKLFEKEKQKR